MRRFLLPSLVLPLAALALACSGDSESARPTEVSTATAAATATATVEPELQAPPQIVTPPDATVHLPDGSEVKAGTGSSCWSAPGEIGVCIDKIGHITNPTPVAIAAGSQIRFDNGVGGSQIDSAEVVAFPPAGRPVEVDGELAWNGASAVDAVTLPAQLTSDGVVVDVDLAPGKWIIDVFMVGQPGDVSYALLVEVQ